MAFIETAIDQDIHAYTRIISELRKLGIKKISCQTIRIILKDELAAMIINRRL